MKTTDIKNLNHALELANQQGVISLEDDNGERYMLKHIPPHKPVNYQGMYNPPHPGEERSANGVKGVLCRSFDGQYFFRVYGKGKEFNDYLLCHDDLAVTITDECASFYVIGDDKYLDHNSQTFGLKTPDKI